MEFCLDHAKFRIAQGIANFRQCLATYIDELHLKAVGSFRLRFPGGSDDSI
ncbi:MAG: hypothetical protein LBK41_09640 [Clostridiales bacterium]|nr:hypothetical protein [Clostridiales bacterium]